MERVCESCAREDDDLVLVRRLYPGGGRERGAEATELWCFSCRSQYPNDLVED